MSKPARSAAKESLSAKLTVPYEAFHTNVLPVGTECIITNEEENRYAVKFPGVIGYSGTFHVKKSYVRMT